VGAIEQKLGPAATQAKNIVTWGLFLISFSFLIIFSIEAAEYVQWKEREKTISISFIRVFSHVPMEFNVIISALFFSSTTTTIAHPAAAAACDVYLFYKVAFNSWCDHPFFSLLKEKWGKYSQPASQQRLLRWLENLFSCLFTKILIAFSDFYNWWLHK
jgi:hypothetical protein